MKPTLRSYLIIIFSFLTLTLHAQKKPKYTATEVYRSDDLIITQITENAFVHTSYKQTNDWGKVSCNGLFVRNAGEVIVLDTPPNTQASEELIAWISKTLKCKIVAVIPTHFHDDSIGGLKAFEDNNIPSFAYFKTIELAKENDYTIPRNSFSDSLILQVGHEKIIAQYFGQGHTIDNVVVYSPSEKVIFGGCLIKELHAGKGYLGDSNVNDWAASVKKIKAAYPKVNLVVPGHGKVGNKKLLDYTIKLFEKH